MALKTNTNTYQTALALDDFNAGDSNKVQDFFQYGLPAAVASGTMSFVNTGKALGNALGAEFEYSDTKDVLDSMGMHDTATYYDANRDWIDTAGFVMGAIIPGLGGIKAAQAMKAGITNYQGTSKMVLGLRDHVYGKEMVEQYTTRLLKEGAYSTNNRKYIVDAAKEGFRDQAVETAFAEAAILLTMNQSPTMTGQDLRYFQAIGDNLDSAALGFVFGTGIGGAIATAQGAKILRNLVDDPLKNVNKLAPATVPPADLAVGRVVPGNSMAMLADELKAVDKAIEDITSGGIQGDAFTIRQLNKRREDVINVTRSWINTLTAAVPGKRWGSQEATPAAHLNGVLEEIFGKIDPETAKEVFGGARRAVILGEEAVLMDVRLSPLRIFDREDKDGLLEAFKDFLPDGVDKDHKQTKKWLNKQMQEAASTNGFTFPGAAWDQNKGKALTVMFDDPNVPLWRKLQTARHEIGHNQTDRLAKFFSTKFGQSIRDEAEALSREMRPSSWRAADNWDKWSKLSKEEIDSLGIFPEDLDKARATHEYIRHPREILADAWAALEIDPFREGRQDSKLYNLFAQNGAAKALYGSNEVLIDVVTKEMKTVADRVPTIADMGEVKINANVKGKVVVKHALGVTEYKYHDTFDLTKEDWASASAKYAAAYKTTALFPKNPTLDAMNLPDMLRYIKGAKDGRIKTDVTVVAPSGDRHVLEFSKVAAGVITPDDLIQRMRALQVEAKAAWLGRIRNGTDDVKTGKYGELEIARMLDISEESVNKLEATARQANGMEILLKEDARAAVSWSEVYDPSRPSAVKMVYNADRRTQAEVEALADIQQQYNRMQRFTSDTVDSVYNELFKGKIGLIASAALPEGAAGNIANKVTDVTPIGGVLTAVQGNYSDAITHVQQVGASHRKAEVEGITYIQEAMSNAAAAVTRSPEALNEYAYLDSYLRTGHYKELPNGDINGFAKALTDTARALTDQPPPKGIGPETYFKNVSKLQQFVREQLVPAMQRAGGKTQLIDLKFETAMQEAFEKPTANNIKRLEGMLPNQFKPVQSEELVNMFRSATEIYGRHVKARGALTSIDGYGKNIDSSVWYPGRMDKQRYKQISFVVPVSKGVFASNRKMIVGGPDAETMALKVQQVKDAFGDKVKIVTPQEAAEYKRYMQEFDSELAFTDWEVNSMMTKKGIMADAAPEPTPQMVEHFVNSMQQDWRTLNNALFSRKHSEEIGILQRAHRAEVLRGGGTVGTLKSKDRELVTSYSKALDVMFNRQSKDLEHLRTTQEKFDNLISTAFNGVAQMFKFAKTPLDFDKLNGFAEQYGLPQVYNPTVRDYLVRTEKVDDRLLSKWMPKINGAAATLMLRWDYIQPIITAISMPVTMHPEFRHLMEELPELQRMDMQKRLGVVNPLTGTTEQSLYPLMMQATKDFVTNKELLVEYERFGLLGGIAREQHEAVDLLTLSRQDWVNGDAGIEPKWKQAASKLGEILAKPADKAEEYAKFTAARVAQLVLETAGVKDKNLQIKVMRTFMTRTMGNYNAAQRPGLFQGPIGQLVGLFQTYQFNVIQQMLRHAGDDPKRVAAMMGIQAGIFGGQSVPGFQVLNAHIAEKSNYENDFYTAANETFGQTVGEWIVYGAASNMIRPVAGDGIELYTRGDLNPRTPILLPTSLEEIPAIGMATRAWTSLSTAAANIGEGAPTGEAFLQAISTLGVNRPLAGIAQMAQGERTTSRGTVLAHTNYDDLSWQQVVMRAMGSKGLDESIAVNAYYRAKQYDASRQEQINQLGMAARLTMRSDNPDPAAFANFQQKYVEYGGKLDNYSSWLHTNTINATQPAIDMVQRENSGVTGRYVQGLMGGRVINAGGGFDVGLGNESAPTEGDW